MTRVVVLRFVGLVLAVAGIAAASQRVRNDTESHRPLRLVQTQDEERKALYQWMDSFLHPELAVGEFGEVRIFATDDEKHSYARSEFGFLQSRKGKGFSIRLLSGSLQSFPHERRPREWEDATFETRDLKGWLLQQKTLWATPQHGFDGPRPYRLGHMPAADQLILSRIAGQHRLVELSDWFYAEAKKQEDWREETRDLSFTNRIKFYFAGDQITDVKAEFTDVSTPRSEILDSFTQFISRFPDSTYRQEAETYAHDLRPMVAEDAVRKPLSDAELAKLPSAEQAKELVWQLRDQTGQQWIHPGYVDVFSHPDVNGDSPADKLVKLGLSAMPALIEGLDDRHLTRTMEGGMHNTRPKVLRICDATMQVISRVANRSFYDNHSVQKGDDDDLKNFRAAVKSWWQQVQSKGEEAVLVRDVSSGSGQSYQQVQRLVVAYPKSAFAAIKAGFGKTDGYMAVNLIQQLAKLATPEAKAFLRSKMTQGKSLEIRLAAANAVNDFDTKAATSAMLKDWPTKPSVEPDLELAKFLVNSHSPQVLRLVRNGFPRMSPSARMDLMENLDPVPAPDPKAGSKENAAELRRYEYWWEALMVTELTDHVIVEGVSGTYNGDYKFTDPRLCDIAAYMLHQTWPKKYEFSPHGSKSKRDQDCLNNLNVWRESMGMKPTHQPTRPNIVEASPRLLMPLFHRLPGDKAAGTEVCKIGLPALPALLRFQKSLPILEGARLDPLINQLSNMVRIVNIKGDPGSANPWLNKARTLTGKSLDTQGYIALLRDFLSSKPGRPHGVRIMLNRDDDLRGVSVTIDFGFVDDSRSGGGVTYQTSTRVGGKSINNSWGSASTVDDIFVEDFKRPIRQAFGTPSNVSIFISVGIDGRP